MGPEEAPPAAPRPPPREAVGPSRDPSGGGEGPFCAGRRPPRPRSTPTPPRAPQSQLERADAGGSTRSESGPSPPTRRHDRHGAKPPARFTSVETPDKWDASFTDDRDGRRANTFRGGPALRRRRTYCVGPPGPGPRPRPPARRPSASPRAGGTPVRSGRARSAPVRSQGLKPASRPTFPLRRCLDFSPSRPTEPPAPHSETGPPRRTPLPRGAGPFQPDRTRRGGLLSPESLTTGTSTNPVRNLDGSPSEPPHPGPPGDGPAPPQKTGSVPTPTRLPAGLRDLPRGGPRTATEHWT